LAGRNERQAEHYREKDGDPFSAVQVVVNAIKHFLRLV
jgi:hypothetical protein